MKISKQQRKELRELCEQKRGEEYVKWIQEQPTYTTFEWVEYLS